MKRTVAAVVMFVQAGYAARAPVVLILPMLAVVGNAKIYSKILKIVAIVVDPVHFILWMDQVLQQVQHVIMENVDVIAL